MYVYIYMCVCVCVCVCIVCVLLYQKRHPLFIRRKMYNTGAL